VVPVKINIDDAFLSNSKKKLNALATKKTVGRIKGLGQIDNACSNGRSRRDVIPSLALHTDPKTETLDCLYFSGLESDCENKSDDLRESLNLITCNDAWTWMSKHSKRLPELRIILTGNNGTTILEEFIPFRLPYTKFDVFYGRKFAIVGNEFPISIANSSFAVPIITTYEKIIYIGISIDAEALKDVRSISVSSQMPEPDGSN
jgi:hypothetical protein